MKTLTSAEAIQVLAKDGKLRVEDWSIGHFIEINSVGILVDEKNERFLISDFTGYVLYEKPKSKKKLWQWRFLNDADEAWHVSTKLMSEESAKFRYMRNYEKFGEAIEVDE